MRKIFLVIVLSVVFSCAITQQQKAERSIKDYLNEKLNDPKSYEAVSFSPVLPNTKSTLTDSTYKKKLDSLESKKTDLSVQLIDIHYPTIRNIKKVKAAIRRDIVDTLRLKNELAIIEKKLSKIQVGWFVSHTYRAKNGFGALTLHSTIFYLSMDCNNVSNVVELP